MGGFALYLVVSFVLVALWAIAPGCIARKKGRSFWGYYFLSFLLSPLISLIIILCLDPLVPAYSAPALMPPRETPQPPNPLGHLRSRCEELRGDNPNLKFLLDEQVQKGLITPSQCAILYKEYSRPDE